MKPYVYINFASSLDGKISGFGGMPFKFSNLEDMKRVHKMRAQTDVILVGRNTIDNDDPKLVVNEKYFRSDHIPDVTILDSKLSVNRDARVFGFPRTVVLICGKEAEEDSFKGRFRSKVIIKKDDNELPAPGFVVDTLGEMGYRKVMIEGGRSVITSFLSANLWDEITVFLSPVVIGAKGVPMVGDLALPLQFSFDSITSLGNGFLVRIKK